MESSKQLISGAVNEMELSAQFIWDAAQLVNCSRNVMALYLLIVFW